MAAAGSQVFISYSREDRDTAAKVAKALEALGWSVFFDVEIRVGESWDERIEAELHAAKAVVVLWSPASAASRWVRNEARIGEAAQKLAPAQIARADLPVEFSHVQAADLIGWNGDQEAPEWRRLVAQIAERMSQEPPLPPRDLLKPVRQGAVVLAVAAVFVGAWWGWDQYGPTVLARLNGTGDAVQPAPVATPVPEQFWATLQQMVVAGLCEDVEAMVNELATQTVSQTDVLTARGQVRLCFANRPAAPAPQPTAETPTDEVVADAATTPAPTPSRDGPLARFRREAVLGAAQGVRPESERLQLPLSVAQAAPVALADLIKNESMAALSAAEIAASAQRLGVDDATVRSLLEVEARPAGFSPDGRPTILFEPHIFSRLTERRFDASHPDISYPRWGANPYPKAQADRWAQLEKAYALDPAAALQAASWGRFQPLGVNYARMGYATPQDMARDLARSEDAQLQAFEKFLASEKLVDPLKVRDWASFSRRYNGPGQVDRYVKLFEAQYTRFIQEKR